MLLCCRQKNPGPSLHNPVSKNLYDKKPVNLGRDEKRSASQQVLAEFCLYSSDAGLSAPIHPSEIDELAFQGGSKQWKPLKGFFLETIRIRISIEVITKFILVRLRESIIRSLHIARRIWPVMPLITVRTQMYSRSIII